MPASPSPRRGAHRVGRRAAAPPESAPAAGVPGDAPGGAPEGPQPADGHWPDEPYPPPPWWRRSAVGPVARSITMSALAVAVVGAVIAAVWLLSLGTGDRSRPDAAGPTGAVRISTTPRASTAPAVPATPTASRTPVAHRSTAAARTPRPARSTHRPAATARPAPPPPATRPAPPPYRPPVLVLNNSRVSGLAAQAADDFRAGGWPVADTGNFTGRIRTTTVYYEPGQEAAARAFADRFPAVERVLPRFAGLPGHGLTVVVTRYYPH